MFRRPALLAAGAALYGGTVAATYFWLKKGAPPEGTADAASASTPAARAARWAALAPTYDATIGFDELVMGVNLLRWWHVGSARGNVLEVCAGSARNLPYYDRGRVSSLTLADACPEMVAVARAKVEASKATLPPTEVVVAAVDDLTPATTPAAAFDTVVDTFGLCSVPDPAAALRAMAAVLAPEGRLILIEHGRTNAWAWLDAQLDAGAAAHLARWGCEWNRDILKAVADAGLVVERVSRWHFGSTTVVYARAPPAKE